MLASINDFRPSQAVENHLRDRPVKPVFSATRTPASVRVSKTPCRAGDLMNRRIVLVKRDRTSHEISVDRLDLIAQPVLHPGVLDQDRDGFGLGKPHDGIDLGGGDGKANGFEVPRGHTR